MYSRLGERLDKTLLLLMRVSVHILHGVERTYCTEWRLMMINVLFYRALWFLFICTALLGVKCDKMAVTVFYPTFPLPLELLKIAFEKLLKRREKRTLFSANVSGSSSPEFNEASFIYSCKQILALFNKHLFYFFLFAFPSSLAFRSWKYGKYEDFKFHVIQNWNLSLDILKHWSNLSK